MIQVFVSHTKRDKEICNAFDNACARVGIKAFRSEFEGIISPPWKTIKNSLNNSVALFFLIGKELIKNQNLNNYGWRYTQNWIAYEIGLACQLGIDIWVICDDLLINFPVPYINNYLIIRLGDIKCIEYFKFILNTYNTKQTNIFKKQIFSYPYINNLGKNFGVICPHENCKIEFNLHTQRQCGENIKCPQCLKDMKFPNGHLI